MAGDQAPDVPRDRRPTWWLPALGLVVVVAALLRLPDLGARPMHHDESLDAWFSWQVAHGEPYSYDPAYHGPLRFYATAALFHLLGESEATARLLAAASGIGLVALAGGLRRWLGDIGSLAAAAFLALSPSMLYFSRFGREDMPFALVELGLLVVLAGWLTRPARWHPPAVGALLGAAFAIKETSFIVVAVLGSYLGGLCLLEALDRRRGRPPEGDTGVGARLLAPGRRALLGGALAGAAVFAACFSVGFTDPGGIYHGAVDGIRYWLSQQPVNRGGQPWPFYLVLLAGYEWVLLPFVVVGAVAMARRPDPVRGLLLWSAVAQLIIYSWASERFPWLVVHPLIPLVLLAGLGVDRLAHAAMGARRTGIAVAAVAAGLLVALGVSTSLAVRVAHREASDPRHLLVSVQTGASLLDALDRVEELYAAAPAGEPPRVVVDTSDSATWPWAWYLRDRPVLYADLAADPGAATDADAVLAIATNVPALPAPPGGWDTDPFAHRVWWLPPWDDGGAGDWWRWITTHQPFGPTGTLDAVLLTRPEP